MTQGIIEIKAEDVFQYADPRCYDRSAHLDINLITKVQEWSGRGIEGQPTAPNFHEVRSHLEDQIVAGKIEPRDLKVRYAGHKPLNRWNYGVQDIHDYTENVELAFLFGPTSFQEWKEDTRRSPEESQRLQELGIEQHGDRGYFFSRGTGAVVLPFTADRKIPVGVRKSEDYDGKIHGAAGWSQFYHDIKIVSPMHDAYRELHEELGVRSEEVKLMDMLGVVAYPHTLEVDIVYFARLQPWIKEAEVRKRLATAVDAKEHKEWVFLSNPDEVNRLVVDGNPPTDSRKFETLASTHYGLSVLRDCYTRL